MCVLFVCHDLSRPSVLPFTSIVVAAPRLRHSRGISTRVLVDCSILHAAMLRSFRFPGLDGELADEVGLYEALDLDIDEVADAKDEQ